MKIKRLVIFTVILIMAISMIGEFPLSKVVEAAASALSWQCFDDGSLDPCHNNLNDLELVSGTQGWAVGNEGVILQWGGVNWTRYNSPTLENLKGIDMLSDDLGWIVGSRGTILTWKGNTWIVSTLSDPDDLVAVAAVSPTDAWTVNDEGKFYRWDGFSWNFVPSPANTYPVAIQFLSANAGWAVGYKGIILHWDGSAWSQAVSPTTDDLRTISIISTTDIWAGGHSRDLYHWDGSNWTAIPFLSYFTAVYYMDMISAADGWLVASTGDATSQLLHWDGVAWTPKGQSIYERLEKYQPIPGKPDQGWAVGWGGRMAYWSGVDILPSENTNTVALNGIDVLSPTNIWIAGGTINSQGPILQYDGISLQQQGSGWLSDIDLVAADYGWAMGTEFKEYWSGIWTNVTLPTTSGINDVFLRTLQDGWAVGGGYSPFECQQYPWKCSEILHWDGTSWLQVTNPKPDGAYQAVDALAANDAWIVGDIVDCQISNNNDCSVILHWNGSQWSLVADSTNYGLNGVSMLSADDVWAVGDFGTFLHWDGVGWTTMPTPLSPNSGNHVWDIRMLSATDGWAVGATGNILHWDGSQWKLVTSPVSSTLNRLGVAAPDDIWAVGANGVILHYGQHQAQLSVNYTEGAPGSYFTLMGSQFPPDSQAAITLNGQLLGTTMTTAEGEIAFTLSTIGAESGAYEVEVSVNPKASAMFIVQTNAPIRSQQGQYDIFIIPEGIAQASMYFPVIKR